MLAKGKGPGYDLLVVGGVEALLVTLGVGTLGTMLSEGQTTFGERNWTFSVGMGGSGGCGVVLERRRDRLLSGVDDDVPGPSENYNNYR